jgi:hypothetical protein
MRHVGRCETICDAYVEPINEAFRLRQTIALDRIRGVGGYPDGSAARAVLPSISVRHRGGIAFTNLPLRVLLLRAKYLFVAANQIFVRRCQADSPVGLADSANQKVASRCMYARAFGGRSAVQTAGPPSPRVGGHER